MSLAQTILGPILNPRADGRVDFIPDGAVVCDDLGINTYVGPAGAAPPTLAISRPSLGIIVPPFLDAHIHIPQWPIRGKFMDGIGAAPPEGRLIAGLNRNVFPAEARCADGAVAREVTAEFFHDTLSKGVVGGAAYMTVHPSATRIAMDNLPKLWQVGMVLMDQNCPEYLRTNRATLDDDLAALYEQFGESLIVTDRFAVAVSSSLRRGAARWAAGKHLRMQTHLNEQLREKQLVEKTLYPDAASYTDVYRRDGLLDREPILAHCVHMSDAEIDLVAQHSGAAVAHCPTSNTLLGSGIMPLNRIRERGIEYSICTDVGASPTTSILAEMAQFLKVHRGRSDRATPSEAFYRATLAPSKMLKMDQHVGRLEVGRPMSFIEVQCDDLRSVTNKSVDDVILEGLLNTSRRRLDDFAQRPECRRALDRLAGGALDIGPDLDCLSQEIDQTIRRLENKVLRVTLAGQTVWQRT